ncbi:unnamed protein product [Periconia digitata]|uniref:3-beta hydroxysteroid dehydrogenase/isomerase domain-containing protein n=1 Tax=Periconia digitata TaxID=1303443 RepID=A0A9W4UHW1_9PLEO|nr:unnamed protein product [Periconia digitata]
MEKTVLITGASGFVGFQTLLLALEEGYTVKVVIRKPDQIQQFKIHPKICQFESKVDYVVVPDLAKKGAFDSVLHDIGTILHIASPLMVQTEDYDNYIFNPAVDMTSSILFSALNAPTVKRVVITSSMVTLVSFHWLSNPDSTKLYTANDMNPAPTRSVSNPMEAYWNSKAFARQAVHEFLSDHKPNFDIVQLLPGAVMGVDDRAQTAEDLFNKTPEWAYRMSPVLGTKQPEPLVSVPVDVEDVAKAHVDAIKPSVPGNRDYILCAEGPEGVEWDSMIDVVKKHFPGEIGRKELPLNGTLPTIKWRVDASDTEKHFGWKFKSFEDSFKDVVAQYLRLLSLERDR